MSLILSRHAYERYRQRFGGDIAQAQRDIDVLYRESTYYGDGRGNVRIFRHHDAFLVLEFAPEGINVVSILPPTFYPPATRTIRPDMEQDEWAEWKSRNVGRAV